MKKSLFAASLVLVAGAAVGCGGGDDGASAPESASTDDFCNTFADIGKSTEGTDSSDTSAQIKAAKDAAAKLSDIGTPADIPADARAGFEILISTIDKIDDNASAEDLSNLDKDVSSADQAKVQAFVTYAGTTCASQLSSEIPSIASSDIPTEIPTDLSTDVPTP